ncbi:MAG: membrane-bound lytic murein transglycosylase MltF, partial [Sideroxydans sp.]
MRSLLPLRLAVLIGLCAWLALKVMQPAPLPDWRLGELVMVVPSEDMETDFAFESDLATLFAQQMKVKLKLISLTPHAAVNALTTGKAHIIAGFRTRSHPSLRYSIAYQTLDERAVCIDTPRKNIEDLYLHHIQVAMDSPQEGSLRELRSTHDDLDWLPVKTQSPAQLLQAVAEEQLDCTVANNEQIASLRNFYPDLASGLSLNAPSDIAWAISADGDEALLDEMNVFLARTLKDNTLHQLLDSHYGHNERLGAVDSATFIANTDTLLPHYQSWFEQAGAETGLDWRLIAALAYRESRWDPNATSFTHVRGMMMLTEDTADRMGVENRLDARTSILAGARYLQMLKSQLPKRINEEERQWMALAAYNQGMGHLEDARILTAQSNLNPDVWADVKSVMPALSRSPYFEQTKHGRARGGEAVIHVETVRLYYDML